MKQLKLILLTIKEMILNFPMMIWFLILNRDAYSFNKAFTEWEIDRQINGKKKIDYIINCFMILLIIIFIVTITT